MCCPILDGRRGRHTSTPRPTTPSSVEDKTINAGSARLSEADRADLLALRPPDDLRALTPRDLPPALAARLTERDGTIGAIIAIKPARRSASTTAAR